MSPAEAKRFIQRIPKERWDIAFERKPMATQGDAPAIVFDPPINVVRAAIESLKSQDTMPVLTLRHADLTPEIVTSLGLKEGGNVLRIKETSSWKFHGSAINTLADAGADFDGKNDYKTGKTRALTEVQN